MREGPEDGVSESEIPNSSETGSPQPDQGRPAGLFSLLGLLALLSGMHQFQRLSLAALSDQIMAAYGKSDVEFGALLTAFFAAYTLAMFAGGWLADRVGTYRTLLMVALGSAIAGLCVGAVGLTLAGSAAGWISLFVVRGTMGCLCAPLYPSTSRTVERWFPKHLQALANGVVTAAAPLGIALSYPIMGWLARRYGWPRAFLASGLMSMLVVFVWARLGKGGSAGGTRAVTGGSARVLFRHTGIWALAGSYLAVGYYEYTIMHWLEHYLSKIRGLEKVESEWLAGIPNHSMMLFTPIGGLAIGWLARHIPLRIALRIVPMLSMTLAAGFLALGALATENFWVVAFVALGMGFIGAAEGPFWTAAVRIGRSHGATAAGIMNTAGNIPGLIAPLLTPLIAKWAGSDATGGASHGWTVALIVTSLICLSGVSSWLWVDVDKPCE